MLWPTATPRPFEYRTPRNSATLVELFYRQLLEWEVYERLDEPEREQELRKRWQRFVEHDLPHIDEAVKSEA